MQGGKGGGGTRRRSCLSLAVLSICSRARNGERIPRIRGFEPWRPPPLCVQCFFTRMEARSVPPPRFGNDAIEMHRISPAMTRSLLGGVSKDRCDGIDVTGGHRRSIGDITRPFSSVLRPVVARRGSTIEREVGARVSSDSLLATFCLSGQKKNLASSAINGARINGLFLR